MRQLSAAWRSMSEQEKDRYRAAAVAASDQSATASDGSAAAANTGKTTGRARQRSSGKSRQRSTASVSLHAEPAATVMVATARIASLPPVAPALC